MQWCLHSYTPAPLQLDASMFICEGEGLWAVPCSGMLSKHTEL